MLGLLVAQGTPAAVITGSVIGVGGQPVSGATVEVVDATPPCATHTGDDGSFRLECEVAGRHALRASFGALTPWQIDDVELAADHTLHLNFLLRAADSGPGPAEAAPLPPPAEGLARPLGNPAVATWLGQAITLRLAGVIVAAAGFLLGAALMIGIGRHLGIEQRQLSTAETADLVVNARRRIGQRLTPMAAGARGSGATISYGVDEIAALFAERRHGVLAAALLAPLSFALSTLGFAVAMLVGQPLYLFLAMLIVPTAFVVTPLVIFAKARAAARTPGM